MAKFKVGNKIIAVKPDLNFRFKAGDVFTVLSYSKEFPDCVRWDPFDPENGSSERLFELYVPPKRQRKKLSESSWGF